MSQSKAQVIPRDGTAVPIIDLSRTCGKYGVLIQNLTNQSVEFSAQQTDLTKNVADQLQGFALAGQGSVVMFNPFAGVLWAHLNAIAITDGKVAVYIFERE
jgi:hypothetical protein